jgi:hypothetical protein
VTISPLSPVPQIKAVNRPAPNVVNFNGTGRYNSTGGVNVLLGSDTFTISVNGKSVIGDELVIVAAFPNGMGGTVNGVSFNGLSSFADKIQSL